MTDAKAAALPLFSDVELDGIQPTGSTWIINDNDPATLPVPLQVVIRSVTGPYTARDRKLWNVLIHAVFDELGKQGGHSVKISDINGLFRSLGGQHETAWIWESAKRLSQTNVEFEITLNDERFDTATSILSASVPRKGKRGSELHFWIPEPLVAIIKEPMRFARLRVHFMIKLSGKYAVTLYELLEAHVNRRDGQCRVSLDELRKWLKVPDGAYEDWRDFRRWVLKPAIDQINSDPLGAGFTVDYQTSRVGRKVGEINFILTKTDQRKRDEKDLKTAIRKKTSLKEIKRRKPNLIIPGWAEEQCQKIAAGKGLGYSDMLREFQDWAESPEDVGAAFVGFCKQKKSIR